MKKYLTQALGAIVALTMLTTACKKDEVKAVVTPDSQPALTASASSVTLLESNAATQAITFTWTPVTTTVTGTSSAVAPGATYKLELARAGTNFATPTYVSAGAGPNTSFKVGDLNTTLRQAGIDPDTPTALDVRLVATYATNSVAYSPSIPLTATTYKPFVCVQPDAKNAWTIIGTVGSGTDWSTDYPMVYDCDKGTFTITMEFKAGQYKFRYANGWDANLGGNNSAGGDLTQDGANLVIAAPGTYTVVLTPGQLVVVDGKTKATTGSFTIQ